jgi:hypothetical protein
MKHWSSIENKQLEAGLNRLKTVCQVNITAIGNAQFYLWYCVNGTALSCRTILVLFQVRRCYRVILSYYTCLVSGSEMLPRYLVVLYLSCFRFGDAYHRLLLIKVWLLNVEKEQLFPLLCCWFHDWSHRCSRCKLSFWRIRSNFGSYIGVVRNFIIIFLFDFIFQWLYLVYQ